MTKKVYIGNLPFETTEQQVRDLFAPYGSIDSITMVRDRETGRFRGYCFVEMKAASEAVAAIAGLRGTEVEGRKVRVNEARSRKGKERKSAPKAQAEKKKQPQNEKDSEEARRRALHGRTQRGGFDVVPADIYGDDDPDALHNRTERGSFGANGERSGRQGGGRRSGSRRNQRPRNNGAVDPDFPFSGGLRRNS